MLNGKTSFDIPNVPADHVLLRFNVLFAYVFEAVSGGKGMLQVKIDPSKNQTIYNLLHETFPTIECYDHEQLHVINPKLIAYIHALGIDCISMTFADSINSRALEHEGAMVDVYAKMMPDAFRVRSQLQTVLTAYYEDIKGVVSASGCTKPTVVKRKFADEEAADAAPAPAPAPAAADPAANANADADADADAATPTTPPGGGAAPAPGGEGPAPAPSPGGKQVKAAPARAGRKAGANLKG